MTSSNERFDESAAPAAGEPQETAAPGEPEPILEGDVLDEADETGADQDAPTDLAAELAAARQEGAERLADLQRLQAEYVNYKRRVDRDRELVRQNATFQVLSGLLPVLDDIDRAREHGEVEGGFKAVADSLERIVAGLGLVKFGEPGDEFDPNLHEALMHAHSPDVTTTTCQSIVQAGYRIGDRVLRAARVTVVDPEPTATE
ncbi:MAG TPA: nucleotide exchange factor GrpE [Nocardioidaceae bacterium]|nr:nucleotide exchange factor GrpE [Nocardioidaceae bacterium]